MFPKKSVTLTTAQHLTRPGGHQERGARLPRGWEQALLIFLRQLGIVEPENAGSRANHPSVPEILHLKMSVITVPIPQTVPRGNESLYVKQRSSSLYM